MRRIRGNRIAMIFQEPMTSLNPVLSIGRQLIEAIEAHTGLSRAEARQRAVEALKAVRISEAESRLKQFPHELSGGMRQRVMIAMALALKPDVLIADEPTTALDVTVQGEVLELLRDLQREHGTSIILITHDMGVVAEMADRVIVMRHGRMVEEGNGRRYFCAPASRLHARAARRRAAYGHRRRPPRIPQAAEAEMRRRVSPCVNDLHVRFDLRGGFFGQGQPPRPRRRRRQLFHRAERDAGAGRRIRLRQVDHRQGACRAGALHTAISSSAAAICRVSAVTQRKAVRRDVQMIFQDPYASLDPRMRVGDLVAEPLLIHGIGSKQERSERVAALFERVGLSADQMELYPHEFSGGQRQRICIARALALRPKLIIADESVSALDVSVQARVLDLLKELQREFGIAYLFISHDMAVVENISDRVAVMYLGQIVEMGTRDQVFSNPRHPYTKRLIEAVPVPDPARRRPRFARLDQEIPSPTRKIGEEPPKLALRDLGNGHLVAVS